MHYDIVIVGGGAVGLSLLWSLSKTKPLKILLLESKEQANLNLSADSILNQDRFIVLSDSSRRFFQFLGCWQAIEAHSTPISAIELSVQGQYGTSTLKADDLKVPALGYVVSLYQLENSLESGCSDQNLMRGASLVECTYDNHWHLTYTQNSKNHSITSDYLIGADGQDSQVRIQNQIELKIKEYGHQAIIGSVQVENSSHQAYERFLDKGAIAFLPLNNHRAVFIWTLPDNEAHILFKKEDPDFLNHLQNEIGYRLGRLSKLQNKKRFPLTMSEAQIQGIAHKKMLLMGAAALNLHPIGAQGLNLSLRTIKGLTQLMQTDARWIEHYLEAIRVDQFQIRWMTDALASYVSGGPFPLILRGLGLSIFDHVPFLKRTFTKISTGLGVF
jgi:2-octaprenyl-6-methoxyphenol hydroxylase